MVVIEIYEQPVNVKYKTTLISKASFIVFLCSLLSVVIPFILAYKSEAFWLKHDMFYEQPKVKFKGEYLLVAVTDNSSKIVICSNLRYYEDFLKASDDCPSIKAKEDDADFDNIFDWIFFQFQITLGKTERLSSINLVLPINYELKSTCLLEMESAIIYQQSVETTTKFELSIYADLQFQQSELIECSKWHKNLAYNTSVISRSRYFKGFQLNNILKDYSERPVKTTLTNVITAFQPKRDSFTINLTVRYPQQTIYFKPNLLQVLKTAWIQYFAIYVLIAWIIFKIKAYVFRKQWVVYYRVDPFKSCK